QFGMPSECRGGKAGWGPPIPSTSRSSVLAKARGRSIFSEMARRQGARRRKQMSWKWWPSEGLVALVVAVNLTAAGTEPRLVDAVKAGDRETVRALLKRSVQVNTPDVDGTTALHWAVRAADLETGRLLLRARAEVNAANRYGVTALSLAATIGNSAMLQTLLDAGGDANT